MDDTDPSYWVGLSADGTFHLDQNVAAQFPGEAKVVSAVVFGSSAWTTTARIHVELSNGELKRYYLKCAKGGDGRATMEGEFAAMVAIHEALPSFIATPVAWGKCQSESPETYFFLSDFVDMSKQVPDPHRLCSSLAELHRNSTSPTRKFGFHVPTFNGRTAQAVDWNSSWTSFFTQLMTHAMKLDLQINGPWEELEQIEQSILSHVVPRLIGALESDGRSIKPCLIHGNLWEGNTGTLYETGEVYIYDGASFYAHNEMEIGDWRCPYNKIHAKIYTKTYLRNYGMSEPTEEWDDRNRMYSVYYNVMYSVNHMGQGNSVRQMALKDMRYLVDKYSPLQI